jgi:hypothetical protein
MRRKIFTTASLLSLLLFVTAASLWAYSFGKEVSFGNSDWSRSFRVERSYFVYSRLLNIPRFYSKSWDFPGIAFRAVNVSDSRTTRPGPFGILEALFVSVYIILAITAILPTMWVIRRRRAIPQGHCPKCRYNLTGNTSGVCPECGTAIPAKVGT